MICSGWDDEGPGVVKLRAESLNAEMEDKNLRIQALQEQIDAARNQMDEVDASNQKCLLSEQLLQVTDYVL